MKLKKNMKSGFTLVELLVVVAIIAAIAAGVLVTYQRLDDRAKTAMEMSDVSILTKVLKHWSVINDYKLPNRLDSLIDSEGNLYSATDLVSEGVAGAEPPSSSGKGLYGAMAGTLKVGDAEPVVVKNLSACGLTVVYQHLVNGQNAAANDSTWEPKASPMMGMTFGAGVDTSSTAMTLLSAEDLTKYNALASAGDPTGKDWWGADAASRPAAYATYRSEALALAAFTEASEIIAAKPLAKLAYIVPEGGARLMGAPMAMNLTEEIIANCGLTPEEIATPGQAVESKQKYYLVVFGLGRFASIYSGKSVRSDTPAYGKRQAQNNAYYNRYLVVVRVPVTEYASMTGSTENPQIACVLTPQGKSAASLRDKYIEDEDKVKDAQ